jgi:hypothetical protein
MSKKKLEIMPSDEEVQKHEQKVKRQELSIIEGTHRKKLKENKIYTKEMLALQFIKVGLSRDHDFVNEDVLLTRSGLTADKVPKDIVKDAVNLVKKSIKEILEGL